MTGAASGGDEPILLVGAPRSGTTLLRAMLNRHPRIDLCDESYFHYWIASRERIFGDLSDAANRERAVDRYLELRRIRRLGLDLAALRRHLIDHATNAATLFLELMRFHAAAAGKVRFGDKTPHHALVARELLRWFPRARLVHLVRDPRDVVESLRRMPWSSGSLVSDARLWRDCVDGVERCGPQAALTVRFEALVERPEAELRRVCQFLGEEFDPAMVTPDPAATSDRWWFERATTAIDPARSGRWRTELSRGDVALVERIAGERLARYGYSPAEPAAGALTAFATVRGHLGAAAAALRRGVRHLPAAFWRCVAPDRLVRQERVYDRAAATAASPAITSEGRPRIR
jgi:sulfotransferase family protein